MQVNLDTPTSIFLSSSSKMVPFWAKVFTLLKSTENSLQIWSLNFFSNPSSSRDIRFQRFCIHFSKVFANFRRISSIFENFRQNCIFFFVLPLCFLYFFYQRIATISHLILRFLGFSSIFENFRHFSTKVLIVNISGTGGRREKTRANLESGGRGLSNGCIFNLVTSLLLSVSLVVNFIFAFENI